MPLPHFGMKEPERVCNNCKLIVDLVWKSQSDNPVSTCSSQGYEYNWKVSQNERWRI